MSELRLNIELVPQTCWFSNVRSILTKKQWDIVKSQVANAAYDMCQICGGIGPKHPVECHEIWTYDDAKQIQKLTGMIALCPDCHRVKHIGLAQIRGKGEQAIKHFMKVNKLSQKQTEKAIQEAFNIWAKRSDMEWTLDISHLKEYGIDVSKIKEPTKQ